MWHTIRYRFGCPLGLTNAPRLLGAVCLLVSLTGCGVLQKVGVLPKPPKPVVPVVPLSQQPFQMRVTLRASSDVNPDTRSRPSPIRLRIFLSEPSVDIGSRTFEEIFEFDGSTMSPAPVATVMLRPGEQQDVTINGMKSQTMLSVAAAFRDPFQAQWIQSTSVDTMSDKPLLVAVTAYSVAIESTR